MSNGTETVVHVKMDHKHMEKKCSPYLAIREMQIKTILRFHHTLIKKTNWALVAHTVILVPWETEIMVQGQLMQVHETPPISINSWVWWHSVRLSSQAGRRMRSGDSWLQARLARQKV
jgi:hypothetical protein